MAGYYVVWPPSVAGGGGGGGVTTVGSMDAQSASVNGATISGTSIYLQSAAIGNTGLVNISAQTFAGVKTFSSGIISSVTGHASLDLPFTGGSMSGAIDMGTNKITSVVDPANAQDAATKNYVDTTASGLNPAQGVYAASIGSGGSFAGSYSNGVAGIGATFTLSSQGILSIDSVSPPNTSRILLKDQTTAFQNGVYTLVNGVAGISGAILTRALDYDTPADVDAVDIIPVLNGTINQKSSWLQTGTINTIGSDSLTFVQWTYNPGIIVTAIGGLDGQAANGNGLTISGNNIYAQSATSTQPGLVNSTSQTFAGVKTFNSAPNFNSLVGGLNVKLDASKNLINGSVSLTGEVIGVLPNANMSAVAVGNAAQVTGSISLTNQISGTLPQGNLTLTPTFTQTTIGSVTQTSSAGGAAYTANWSGTQGSSTLSYLVNNGQGNLSWFNSSPSITILNTLGSGTFQVPTNAKAMWVRCLGGGGGGGGVASAATTSAGGGGGGGAGYSEKFFVGSAMGSVYGYIIGNFGSGGAAGNNSGIAGSATIFSQAGSTILTAGGGGPGAGSGAQGQTSCTANGGGGGSASGGDMNVPGQNGGWAFIAGTATSAVNGEGGQCVLGAGGGQVINTSATGAAGSGYGGGGAGGIQFNNGGNQAGGNGAQGAIIIHVYYN